MAPGGPPFLARGKARPGQGRTSTAVGACLAAGSVRGDDTKARHLVILKESALQTQLRAAPAWRFSPSKGFSGRAAGPARPFLLPLNLPESQSGSPASAGGGSTASPITSLLAKWDDADTPGDLMHHVPGRRITFSFPRNYPPPKAGNVGKSASSRRFIPSMCILTDGHTYGQTINHEP